MSSYTCPGIEWSIFVMRLVQITQAIKKRITLPGCCCGYTLDQAVLLENEVRTRVEGLPAVLTVSPVNGSTNTVEVKRLLEVCCRTLLPN